MDTIEIFKLFGSIFVDNDEANKSIGKTDKKTDGLTKRLGKGIKTAGKWALGLGAAAMAVGAAMFAMTNKVVDGFVNIADESKKMGVSTDVYQEMDYWAKQNGVSTNNMEKAMGRLNQRIGKAADGNEKYSGALEALGINMNDVRDGTLSTEDAMAQSVQALSEMSNEQEKSALASELFGTKLSRELMPALQDGSLSIEEAAKKAHELGIVIDEDTIGSAEKFHQTWEDLKAQMGSFGQKVMGNLIPVFQSMMDWVMDHMPQIQAIFQTVFEVIGEVFGTAIELIQSIISWLSDWFESNQEMMTGIWETIQNTFTTVWEFLQEIFAMIMEWWVEYGEQLIESFIQTFNLIKDSIIFAFETIWEFLQQIFELIMPFIQETLETLFNFWNAHGEQIMQAIKNAFDFIKGVIDVVMPYIQGVIKVAWGIISNIISTTIGVIIGIIQAFAALFTGDWKGLWNAVKNIASSIWNGIKKHISVVLGAIKTVISSVWNGIKSVTTSVWSGIKSGVMGFVNGLKSAITTAFDAIKTAVSNVWEGIKSTTKSVWDGMVAIVKAPVNLIIGAINGMINGINKIHIKSPKIPSWVPVFGGKGFDIGFNIPNIPSLDVGTNYVAKDGLARIHEGEAVVPKEYNPAADGRNIDSSGKIINLLMQIVQAIKEGKVIKLNGRVLGEITDEEQGKRVGIKGRRVAY